MLDAIDGLVLLKQSERIRISGKSEVIKYVGAGANVKGQHAGCFASGQPLTEVTRKTLFDVSGHLRRSLPPGEGMYNYFLVVHSFVDLPLNLIGYFDCMS